MWLQSAETDSAEDEQLTVIPPPRERYRACPGPGSFARGADVQRVDLRGQVLVQVGKRHFVQSREKRFRRREGRPSIGCSGRVGW